MQSRRSFKDHPLAAAALLSILLATRPALAQQTPPQALEQILQRLENNLRNYDTQVPSFLCDEHVTSKKRSEASTQETFADSVFRLKRVPNPDETTRLVESRDIKTVDGKVTEGDDIHGPTSLSGAFTGGLALVSLNQQACMSYTLREAKPGHPDVIQFASVPASDRHADCLLQEDVTGQVRIDPATTQITRMEFHVPHHLIVPPQRVRADLVIPPAVGSWDLVIDYGPVLLGGRTFWVPMTIDSTMSDRSVGTIWSFIAHYTNYHKLEVTSRIVPSTHPPAP